MVQAWELGNELHTPVQPPALEDFLISAVAEVRAVDPLTPILPGTMGANHVEPGNHLSPIARWLYCDAPVDAYTLHAYDWVSRDRPGDMPIDWDLDNIVSQPCPNGRGLPIIVEELGTSRALPGVYSADDELARVHQEVRQIEFVRQFRGVVGLGVWNGESPRLVDRTFVDVRRGLTSYGAQAHGRWLVLRPVPESAPGVRCLLEQVLRGIRFVRVDGADRWTPSVDATTDDPLSGSVDPVSTDSASNDLALSGWVTGASDSAAPAADALDAYLGSQLSAQSWLGTAQLGLPRTDVPPSDDGAAPTNPGFRVTVPLNRLSPGQNADQPGRALGTAWHVADRGAGHRPAAGSDSDGRATRSGAAVGARPGGGARPAHGWKCSRRRRRPMSRAGLPCRCSPRARIGSTSSSTRAETVAADWPAPLPAPPRPPAAAASRST